MNQGFGAASDAPIPPPRPRCWGSRFRPCHFAITPTKSRAQSHARGSPLSRGVIARRAFGVIARQLCVALLHLRYLIYQRQSATAVVHHGTRWL